MLGKPRTTSSSPPTSRHSGMPPMSPLKDGSEKHGQKRKEYARVKGAIHKNRPSAWMARASLDRGHPQKQASSVDDSGSRRSMHTETGPQRHKCSDVRGWSIGPERRQQSAPSAWMAWAPGRWHPQKPASSVDESGFTRPGLSTKTGPQRGWLGLQMGGWGKSNGEGAGKSTGECVAGQQAGRLFLVLHAAVAGIRAGHQQ